MARGAHPFVEATRAYLPKHLVRTVRALKKDWERTKTEATAVQQIVPAKTIQ